jgi:class 3 adenylate cyclase
MGKKVRILIVEDESIIALDIKNSITALGYEVCGLAASVEEAVNRAELYKPDLILMDINLQSGGSGVEASKIIHEKNSIPVIYLTGLVDQKTLEEAKITEPFGYVLKPFTRASIRTAVEMGLYKHKIELELKRKTKELEEEKKKTDALLHNILPDEIIVELQESGFSNPRLHKMITIMFTDFFNFSSISASVPSDILLTELDDIFNNFDKIIENNGLEKLKTIGDVYMIGGGLPKESSDHAVKMIQAALEMKKFIIERNQNSKLKLTFRAGINSGQVVAGIVGNKKFTYDVWGDTVNIASRIGTHSGPGMINISNSTYLQVNEHYDCDYWGKLSAAPHREVDMYLVKGKK